MRYTVTRTRVVQEELEVDAESRNEAIWKAEGSSPENWDFVYAENEIFRVQELDR